MSTDPSASTPSLDRVSNHDRFTLAGHTVKGEFKVESFVAEGGFGVVYKAEQITVGRPAALKVLKTPEDYTESARAEFLDNFAKEARTLGRLAHPNIVQVLDFGVDPMPNGETAAWMALEWIPGVTLEDDLKARRKQGGRTPEEVMGLMRDVLRAMAHAHDLGVAHRDLKPANVMHVYGKREVTARLLDFGIAKMMDPSEAAGSGITRTTSAQSACSPRYAAPEQFSSGRTGPWSDVHALGMILTEMLTDRPCYPGKTMNAIIAEGLSRTRPTPAKFGVDVGAWEAVLAKASALRPDDRWKDAGALLDALVEALPRATHPRLGAVAMTEAPAAPLAGGPLSAPTAPTMHAAQAPAVVHVATRPGPMPAGPLPTDPLPFDPTLGATQALPPTSLPATTAMEQFPMPAPAPPPSPSGDAFGATMVAHSPSQTPPRPSREIPVEMPGKATGAVSYPYPKFPGAVQTAAPPKSRVGLVIGLLVLVFFVVFALVLASKISRGSTPSAATAAPMTTAPASLTPTPVAQGHRPPFVAPSPGVAPTPAPTPAAPSGMQMVPMAAPSAPAAEPTDESATEEEPRGRGRRRRHRRHRHDE